MNAEQHGALEAADSGIDWSLFTVVRPERSNDTLAIGGFLVGIGMLAASVLLSGSAAAFVDVPSLLIVFGGTLAVLAVGHPAMDLVGAARLVGLALTRSPGDPAAAAAAVVQVAEVARRRGTLSMEHSIDPSPNAPMLHKGISMVMDGMATADVEAILGDEVRESVDADERAIAVVRHAAEAAPAMGLIGTLIGLVQMLGHLEDPSTIGRSMAVALLTTLYGAILAHMALSPLTSKLEKWSAGRTRMQVIAAVGVLSIARQENPRRLEMRLNTLLPAGKRLNLFD